MDKSARHRRASLSRWQIAQSLAVLIGLVGLLAFLGWLVARWVGGLEGEIGAAIVLGFVGLMTGLLSSPLNKYLERRHAHERELREKRAEAYSQFTSFWFRALFAQKVGVKPPSQREMNTFVQQSTEKFIFYASDRVLKRWRALRRTFQEAADGSTAQPEGMLYQFGELLMAIRSDLGHSNAGIEVEDLLALWITDVDRVQFHAEKGGGTTIAA